VVLSRGDTLARCSARPANKRTRWTPQYSVIYMVPLCCRQGAAARCQSRFAHERINRILRFDAAPVHRTIAAKLGTIGTSCEAAGLRRIHVDVPRFRA